MIRGRKIDLRRRIRGHRWSLEMSFLPVEEVCRSTQTVQEGGILGGEGRNRTGSNPVRTTEFLAKPLISKNAHRCCNFHHDSHSKPRIKPTNTNLYQHPPTGSSTVGVRFGVRRLGYPTGGCNEPVFQLRLLIVEILARITLNLGADTFSIRLAHLAHPQGRNLRGSMSRGCREPRNTR